METGPENRGLDLEKELTCSICTEVLYQPITLLDCLHTFCASCAKEWFSFQLSSSRNNPKPGTAPFTCPSCRDHVRSTRHDAKVTTLLEMFLAANPAKARTRQEMIDLEEKYRPGDIILPKVEVKEKSLRERRADDEDARLLEEVRGLSLREVGVEEGSSERRERRRREGERLRPDGTRHSREQSRDSRDSRSGDDRERRRRRETDSGRRRRDDATLHPETEHVEERRRRRSNDEARRRHEETSRTAASQLEHQSSLRSLISSSDVDAREMEEEILRQIREEGLLDGIDLENIDVGQEDQISERIAEAYRKRQAEKAREERERRRASGHRRQHSRSAPESRETSGDDRSTRRRTHSRAISAVSAVSTVSAMSQSDEPNRPPPALSAVQAGHLEVHSSDEGRRRRRTTSGSRSSTEPVPVAETQARPAARSQTDLSNRPHSAETNIRRPSVTASSRSATEPNNRPSVELAGSEPVLRDQRSTNSSPRIGASVRMEDSLNTLNSLSQSHWSPSHDTLTSAPFTGSALTVATSVDQALMPAPLSPNHSPNHSPRTSFSLSDRATAFQSAARPTSSSGANRERKHSALYPEPSITCARCSKTHIEYELHYNCATCYGGNYNICLSCFRAGSGCLHWFGFGYSAWTKWEAWANDQNLSDAEKPHMLIASRYLPPPTVPGGAPGRKTLTKSNPQERLQSGVFCANCLEWANECYWRCETCNEGDWGFCNTCVNQGKCCTHSLLPLTFQALESDKGDNTPPGQALPASASILTGPGVQDIGRFKPLTFTTQCDICHYGIPPGDRRYHCLQCMSKVPGTNTKPGDYDICMACYPKLITSRRISAENGNKGWRRCLQGHRMIIVGFKNTHGGLRRYVAEEMVGGWSLKIEPFVPPPTFSPLPSDLQKWSWPSPLSKDYFKLVTINPMNTPPPHIDSVDQEEHFPPSGGSGMRCLARWSWWPAEGVSDELAFPKGAELREARDVNGEWWFGTYMGKCGLYPGGYGRILEGGR